MSSLTYFIPCSPQIIQFTVIQPDRRSNEFHLPLLRTLLAQNTFVYDGPKFWNSLSNDIRNAKTIHSFKSKLKSLLLKSYNTQNN